MIRYAWLVPSLPAVAFFLILFLGKRTPGRGAPIGIAAVGASFVMSIAILFHFVGGGEPVGANVHYLDAGSFHLEIGQYVDGLTAAMFVVVTTVSLLVQIYSTAYMHGDRRYTFFYASLSIFTAAMLNVVLADNLFQLLVGWEVMGICSYLLIGHWWEEKENSSAAIKAFLTTRVGDVAFMFGIFVITIAAGTSNIQGITELVEHHEIAAGTLTVAALLLFGGAIGKSAQFPLHVWLPDAMAGPTPVSALIHAATMVAAGVYLVGRMFAVFAGSGHALAFVGTIASITMLIAALLAMMQDDIKRVLAYSTVSQLAYMVAGLSLGEAGYTAGLFHLFTHAFFKALLFLGAGSVIHAVHTNNMSEMGGLRKFMPVTFVTFLIGSAALAGIPPFAGFWSKDEIISTAFHSGHYAIWAVALATAIITAFYMTRAVLLTFFGEYRGHGEHAAHPHESPRAMTIPLIVLATGSVVVGFLNATALHIDLFTQWVHFGPEAKSEPFNYGFAAISIVGALAGIWVGYRLYAGWRERDPLRNLGPAYTVLERKYFLDDIYLGGIVRPIQYQLSAAVYWTNQHILDGAVNAAAWATRKLATAVNEIDRRVVDGAVNGTGSVTRVFSGFLRFIQSGNVQSYAVLLFVGTAFLAIAITRGLAALIAAAGLVVIALAWAVFRTKRSEERS
ncbi:MAG TPA: NADH-quinone oxidoreductase subunit L [Actinomycetota bacterium]|nr:NADH-quinone oxidoreductase subunit L [Actinomycetota bacterium]